MAHSKLSDEEIAARMVELRNLRKLHTAARRREKLKDARILELETIVTEQQAVITTLQIQMAELQAMVFGKKRRPPMGGTPIETNPLFSAPAPVSRTKDSYRRPLPPATAITATELLSIDRCECGGELRDVTTHERYQEDIPLPELTPDYQAKLVTKYLVQRGVCGQCGRITAASDLGGQFVRLGPNVRLLICHLVSVAGMTYNGVATLLRCLYSIAVSDGEISSILTKQHEAWLPAYEQLKADIRAAPVVHVDETPWAIQQNDGLGYAWCLSDATSEKVLYSLENSRGATHAKAFFGTNTLYPFAGIRISDDYGAYRSESLPGLQQLCWAHLYRSIRDLRYNANLPKEQLPYVTEWHAGFAGIYTDLRTYLKEPYDEVVRIPHTNTLWERIQLLAGESAPSSGEPDKLAKLKAQLLRAGKDKLLVCLTKDTPCDNNRAERDLRQLVLKRRRSFGSQTERGAKALSTILSVCTTTWRTADPARYFSMLASLAG